MKSHTQMQLFGYHITRTRVSVRRNKPLCGVLSADANIRAANVKQHSGGGSQNRLHVQKAVMEYLLLGKFA
jgi:hypothetical protein